MLINIPNYLKLQKKLTDYGDFYQAKGIEDFLESQSPEGRIEICSLIRELSLCFRCSCEFFSEELVGRQSPYYAEDRPSKEEDSVLVSDDIRPVYSYLDYVPYSYIQLDLPFDYDS